MTVVSPAPIGVADAARARSLVVAVLARLGAGPATWWRRRTRRRRARRQVPAAERRAPVRHGPPGAGPVLPGGVRHVVVGLSALVAVAIGVLVGGPSACCAGFFGGWVDVTLARLVDVLLAVPGFLLAVVIVSSLGFQTINAAIATGVSAVAVFARVMRSEVIKVRARRSSRPPRCRAGRGAHPLPAHPAQRLAVDPDARRPPVRPLHPRDRRPRIPRLWRPAPGVGLGSAHLRPARTTPRALAPRLPRRDDDRHSPRLNRISRWLRKTS